METHGCFGLRCRDCRLKKSEYGTPDRAECAQLRTTAIEMLKEAVKHHDT